jgi:hypothetical protein
MAWLCLGSSPAGGLVWRIRSNSPVAALHGSSDDAVSMPLSIISSFVATTSLNRAFLVDEKHQQNTG